MSRPDFVPLPPEFRARANVAAGISGGVAFIVAGFLFSPQTGGPRSLAILAAIALIAVVAASIAASDNFDDAIDHQELVWRVQCGSRAAALSALVSAGMIVLGARVFGSQGAAFGVFIPSALSILPSYFFALLAAAIAAGVRVPAAIPRESQRKDNGSGVGLMAVLVSAAGFASMLVPPGAPATVSASTVSNAPRPPFTYAPSAAPNVSGRSEIIQPPTPAPVQTPYSHTAIAATPLPAWTPTVFNTPPPTYPRSLDTNDPAFAVIHAFIVNHHNTINRGDLNALMQDYADEVVYFRNGVVNRAAIYRDERASRSRYRQYVEQIIYPIQVSELSPGHYHAQYQIAFSAQKMNNQMTSGTAPVHLYVKDAGNGLRIVSQQNQIEHGE